MRTLRIILLLAGTQLRIILRNRATAVFLIIPGIILYSIFTSIFAGSAGRPFRVAVVDQDNTPASKKLIEMLRANKVKVVLHEKEDPKRPLLTEESARASILHEGLFRVVLVIPKGYAESPNMLSPNPHQGIDLIYDESQTWEAEIVTGMVQMAAGRALFEQMGGMLGSGPARRSDQTTQRGTEQTDPEKGPAQRLIQVHSAGVIKSGMPNAAKNIFLAAIVPMFIMFGAAGAARSMLEAIRRGEIRRLLAAPIGAFHIVTGQLVACVTLALIQCYAMYLYAWLVFDVGIWHITGGLFVLTLATCLAATALGMLMASLCRTAEQLDSLGPVVILAMSALGGSMVPRFVMPVFMQKLGLFTINGWAYDGFMALIRREGFWGIFMPLLVLTTTAGVLIAISSAIFARRLASKPASG
ncbi:MAG TPA: ABC transporter permease [Phycisphaerae bacterium]|nr:ABC transporter permease [Phycisphaerae bacterium]